MIIAALLVGGLTAFYFGVRPGAVAAGASMLAFLAAAVAPALAIYAYLAVGAGVGGVLLVGPKRADPTHAAKAMRFARRGMLLLRARLGGKRDERTDRDRPRKN